MPFPKASLGDQVNIESKAGMGVDNLFIMPIMSIVYKYNNDITLGFAAAPAGGGGAEYQPNLFNAQSSALDPNDKLVVDLMIMHMTPSIAYKLDDKQSVAASLVIAAQRFKAEGLELFDTFTQTQTSDNLSAQGHDYSYGAGIRLAWHGQVMEQLRLGAVYTSRIYMSKFDKYNELFAEGGDIDTPSTMGVGLAYAHNDDLDILFDITYTMYEDVKAIGNTGPNITGVPLGDESRRLGLENGLGFGWKNQLVFKLGANYRYSDDWTLRTGWNYGESPIQEDREIIFNIAAPAVTQNHLTVGATYKINANSDVSFSYMHAFEFEQYGPTYIGNNGTISMSQEALGFSYSSSF
jgi:long-chain fatty acid transport protein